MLSILGCNSRQSENVQSESDETEVTAAGERTATKYFYINSPKKVPQKGQFFSFGRFV